MITLKNCPKAYSQDQDKACSPEETVARVQECFGKDGGGILGELRRIDTGRLGIPVYVSMCGDAARRIMPTRKQMGKGASPAQAQASALMELVERYSFFSFWENARNFSLATYSRACERWDSVLPMEKILQSVNEDLSIADATRIMDLVTWRFCPATNITEGREEQVPIGWFKMLGEFNGSSAGNTPEESILQGSCELVERHVCAIIDRERPELPTIDPKSFDDPVLCDLYEKFRKNGIEVVIKDFSLGMPVPTVAVVAWDPSTFPGLSEIVYTAGTSASPVKAAIRALTEVAQLAGDFQTGAVYEASGLTKYDKLDDIEWLRRGPTVRLDSLPTVERGDILDELHLYCKGLKEQGFTLYSIDTTTERLGLPANYNFVPGFQFRERDRHSSLGLFVGRYLAEEAKPGKAELGLNILEGIYPSSHFVPFFRGMLTLRNQKYAEASTLFAKAETIQPDEENMAMSAFYSGYALTLAERWNDALPALDRALGLTGEVKEYFNLRGVCHFKKGDYERAAADFSSALDIDRGSAMDLANLGVCTKLMGHRDKAVDYLSTAVKLDPGLDFARAHLDELTRECGA